MREYWQLALEWSGAHEEWRPVSRWPLVASLTFYVVFLVYAFRMHGGFLFVDLANLVAHEGGHLLFGWAGQTLGVWGGTLLELLVPLLLAGYFFRERQAVGFALCAFLLFENFLYIATYMADARAMALPLVTTGDSDFVEHDWNTIFSSLGMLQYDTTIAAIVRAVGWLGMLACVGWLSARFRTAIRLDG